MKDCRISASVFSKILITAFTLTKQLSSAALCAAFFLRCSTFVSRLVRAPKVVPRVRTWKECCGLFEKVRAFHVIFIEWVDTHYFALQGPYDRVGHADRAERSCINDARTRARFLGPTYNFAQAATYDNRQNSLSSIYP